MSREFFLRLLAIAFVAVGLTSCATDEPVTPGTETLKIGGLFSTTGNWSTLGKAADAAAELAVEDVNAYFIKIGSKVRVSYQNRDTRLDAVVALDALRDHHASGIHIVVGPQSSAEVSGLKAFADSAGVIVISPSSTAGTLAITDDNILRMCPADIAEGPAIAAMMIAEGRTHIVPFWRNDIGNTGLKNATAEALLNAGASITFGMSYEPDIIFNDMYLNALRSKVMSQIAAFGRDSVGIYNPGFDEVKDLFAAIPLTDTILRGVRWYGGDGTAMSEALYSQVSFIMQASYPNPLFGIGDGAAVAGPIADRIRAKSGMAADAYSLSVYDAIWIAATAYRSVPSTSWNAASFRENFINEAANTFGKTGWTKLNAAGDREYGNFDMMAIRLFHDEPKWVRIGTYSSSSNTYKPE